MSSAARLLCKIFFHNYMHVELQGGRAGSVPPSHVVAMSIQLNYSFESDIHPNFMLNTSFFPPHLGSPLTLELQIEPSCRLGHKLLPALSVIDDEARGEHVQH